MKLIVDEKDLKLNFPLHIDNGWPEPEFFCEILQFHL